MTAVEDAEGGRGHLRPDPAAAGRDRRRHPEGRGVRAGPVRQHGRLEDGGRPAGGGPDGRLADRARPLRGCSPSTTWSRPRRSSATGLTVAGDHARFQAVEFLSRLEARGGTEMAAPLARAVDLLAGPADGEPAGARPRAGAGDRRAGRQRGPDPAPARPAAGRGARLHGRGGHGGQRGVPQAAGRAGRWRLRAGRVRGPAGRGDGPGPPAHRDAGADRPGAGAGRAGGRPGVAGSAAPARPVRRVAAGGERPVRGRARAGRSRSVAGTRPASPGRRPCPRPAATRPP